jgi:spore coat polysaccharide biosynthesis protein SpsF
VAETRVVIGIQARSTSKRFPGKVFEMIGDKSVLQHVLHAALGSSLYLNNTMRRSGVYTMFALAIPQGDRIAKAFPNACMVEGPENDVLKRYVMLAQKFSADYIVRITGDCPLLPSPLITKHIKVALKNAYDYVSNVHEEFRTSLDGFDVEVFSRKMLDWADQTASIPSDREHVTTFMRRHPPEWAKIGHVINYISMANVKLSVDTPEDLERVRVAYNEIKRALKTAEELHGKAALHRF